MAKAWCCVSIGLFACGAAHPTRPAKLGAGYFHNLIHTDPGCHENDDCETSLSGGQGGQLEAVLPRERVTPRLSLTATRERIEQYGRTEWAVAYAAKLDWLYHAREDVVSVHLGLGFGIDGMAGPSSASGASWNDMGLDLHALFEVEYQSTPDWSFVGGVTPELAVLFGDGLTSDMTGLRGFPVYLGVRRAVQ
jgi:hypothetical protein